MAETLGIMGWDLGGAHLKLARLSPGGRVLAVEQHACPMWKGIGQLESLLGSIHARIDVARYRHAVTMTGELVDIFPDRIRGVRALLRTLARHFGAAVVHVYTLKGELRPLAAARARAAEVASANWHATAALVARQCREALIVDIGSTTTDLVPVRRGRIDARGYTDGERMAHGELVYTGVVRTPLMAMVNRLPFAGQWQGVAAEWFATTGDVYLLTGQLSRRHYQADTADGGGLSDADCARRLARMLGRDAAEASLAGWRRLAHHIAGVQREALRGAVERVLSRQDAAGEATIVGAGCGRFIAREIARELRYPYLDIAEMMQVPHALRDIAAVCAPAVAVARLAQR